MCAQTLMCDNKSKVAKRLNETLQEQIIHRVRKEECLWVSSTFYLDQ